MIARDAWHHPALLLNAWGRTGTTLTFMVPAAAGLSAARAAALVMSAATVLVTTQVARVVGARTLFLLPAFLWFQPWFHLYANAVLTEVPFSLVMIAACWAALTGRMRLASLLFGCLPLIRHEGIAVVGLWMAFAFSRRRLWLVAIAALPLIASQLAFALAYGTEPFAVYFHTRPTMTYGHGGWFHYTLPLARSIGPPVAVLALVGLVAARRNRRLLLLAAPYALYLVVELLIFRFGLFGSGGDADYLLPLATAVAVAATFGADRVVDWLEPRRAVIAPAAVAALLGLAVFAWALRTAPARADGAAVPMRAAVRFLSARGVAPDPVIATHVWYFELSGAEVPVGHGLHSPWSQPPRPRRIGPGRLVVWDCFYSSRFGLRWAQLRSSGFRELEGFGGGRVLVLRRGGAGRALPRTSPCRKLR